MRRRTWWWLAVPGLALALGGCDPEKAGSEKAPEVSVEEGNLPGAGTGASELPPGVTVDTQKVESDSAAAPGRP